MALIDLSKTFGQPFVTSFIAKFTAVIKNRLRKGFPDFIAHRLTGKLARRCFDITPKFDITLVAPGKSDDNHVRWQFAVGGEIVQGGEKLPMSEIACSAEDDDAARLRDGPRG